MTFNTPMLKQYSSIKAAHEDCIVLFRLGDFYEMFDQDARVASNLLSLTLTGRGKAPHRVDMCGVPHHAAQKYITQLVQKGHKVAICEQTEPAAQKGLTKRDVVRIVTPGTLTEEGHLSANAHNYLLALSPTTTNHIGVGFVDISTGLFKVGVLDSSSDVSTLIHQLGIQELLIPHDYQDVLPEETMVSRFHPIATTQAQQALCQHFNVQSLQGFGIESLKEAFPCAWGLIQYLQKTQKKTIEHLHCIHPFYPNHYLKMDRATLHNLDILSDQASKQSSLFSLLNQTKTPMGARRLKQLLTHPFAHQDAVEPRLEAVENLVNDLLVREDLSDLLPSIKDIERLSSRISLYQNNPRDCLILCQSLRAIYGLPGLLGNPSSAVLQSHQEILETHNQNGIPTMISTIETCLVDDPPALLSEGHIIKAGYSDELDTLKQSFEDTRQWITNLEERERTATGIKSLKVGFNRVFGYYLECPKTASHAVPDNYIRKQTLSHAERYMTPELKEKETLLLNGQAEQIQLETRLFTDMIQKICPFIPDIHQISACVADLDVLQSFAVSAQKNGYCKPTFQTSQTPFLAIEEGKHPLLATQPHSTCIPNSITLDGKNQPMGLITGPNMAGKSTLMRQVALTIVMAQAGSFVPAKNVSLTPADQLFTRIGAMDNLYAGQSTFMVEMLETAHVLNNASEASLILVDELGRGTSTADGVSLAVAIMDYLRLNVGARTLFSTHYHELPPIMGPLKEIACYTMGIIEDNHQIAFTYQLQKGVAHKSYGLHVAKIAGIPDTVIQNAQHYLDQFEQTGAPLPTP